MNNFILGLLLVLFYSPVTMAYEYFINFRFEIGGLPKSAKQKSANGYDYKFSARDWEEAVLTSQNLLGADYKSAIDQNCGASNKKYYSCAGSNLTISGIELHEGEGRNRSCLMGDMKKSGLGPCPTPKWKGSPVISNKKPRRRVAGPGH